MDVSEPAGLIAHIVLLPSLFVALWAVRNREYHTAALAATSLAVLSVILFGYYTGIDIERPVERYGWAPLLFVLPTLIRLACLQPKDFLVDVVVSIETLALIAALAFKALDLLFILVITVPLLSAVGILWALFLARFGRPEQAAYSFAWACAGGSLIAALQVAFTRI